MRVLVHSMLYRSILHVNCTVFIGMTSTRSEDVIYYNNFESNSPLFEVRLLLTGFAFCTPGETEEMTVPLNFAQVLFSTRGVRMFAPALYAAPRAFSSCQVLLRGNFENFGLNLDIAVFTHFHVNCLSFYTRLKCQFANNFNSNSIFTDSPCILSVAASLPKL